MKTWLIDDVKLEPLNSSGVAELHDRLIEKYKPIQNSGNVGEADLLLIAYAKKNSLVVVTHERVQDSRPESFSGFKIPAACKEEEVEFCTFIKMLTELEISI